MWMGLKGESDWNEKLALQADGESEWQESRYRKLKQAELSAGEQMFNFNPVYPPISLTRRNNNYIHVDILGFVLQR